MGRDKAFLQVRWEGTSVPLWERQLSILEAVLPAEVMISGPRKNGYPESLAVYADQWQGMGPLGGLATCLKRMNTDLLLILVDLPRVQSSFLKKLLSATKGGCGIVPILNNHYEPLIAIYPKAALEPALVQLGKRDYVLQHFVERLLEDRLVTDYQVEPGEQYQLENWNKPADLRNPF